ncbi:MAG TPA: class II aldolase/adducin family protein [Thermoanaerobaculia bacterium]|jgi:L-fuculose-phosphate aldolase|nr:class II aldolase/adducin family protein [Thermoanaerobaculia bacterium]
MALVTEFQLKQAIVRVAKRLDEKGILTSTDGNLSARLADGGTLITPSGSCKGQLEAEKIVRLFRDGSPRSGKPSSEIALHQMIYARRPDVQAIVHAHPPYATAYAVAGMALDQPILSEAILTLGRVPVASYAMPTAVELARSVEPLVEHHDAVLLRFHGAICFARDIEQAGYLMETLEHVARIDFIRRALGSNELIPPQEVARLEELRASMRAR